MDKVILLHCWPQPAWSFGVANIMRQPLFARASQAPGVFGFASERKSGGAKTGHSPGCTPFGQSFNTLQMGCSPWEGKTEVAVIAGNKPQGLGKLVAPFTEDNDGTVGISETQLEGIVHHRIVPTSHSGLLWCPNTAHLTAHFLQSGCFPIQTPP